MKNLLLLLFAFTSLVLSGQNVVEWVTIEEAQLRAKNSKKPILIDVYTTWCKPCQKLSKTFENEKVAVFVNKHFIPVKFDAEHAESVEFDGKIYHNPDFDATTTGRKPKHELPEKLGIYGYPTLFVLENKTLEVLEKFIGYKSPYLLLETLKESKAL